MARRTTRNKIRWNVSTAIGRLSEAQIYLSRAAALADDRSPLLNDALPPVVTTVEMAIKALEQLYPKL